MKTSKFIYLALLPLVVAQCKVVEIEGEDNPSEGEMVELTLMNSSIDSKTSMAADGSVIWSEGDFVRINDGSYPITLDSQNPGLATVTVPSAFEYLAAYPEYAHVGEENGNYLIYIGDWQEYKENSFGENINTAVAYSTTKSLEFHNIGGIVRIGLTGSVVVSEVRFVPNDGGFAAGCLRIPVDDIKSGNLADRYSDFMEYGSTSVILYTYSNQLLSASEPTWFDMVVAPRTYKGGFTVYVTDADGNVCAQTTTSDFDVVRSTVNPKEPFKFTPLDTPGISVTAQAPTTFDFNIVGREGLVVKAAVISGSYWNTLTDKESSMHWALANSTYETVRVGADGVASFVADRALNAFGNEVGLSAASNYVVVACYMAGDTVLGTTAISQNTNTTAAEGAAPTITATLAAGSTYNRLLLGISATNAASIQYALMTSAAYQKQIAGGLDNSAIVENYGLSLSSSELAQALSGGFTFEYTDDYVMPNTGYTLVAKAVSAGGVEKISSSAATTVAHIDPNATWTVVAESVNMWMDGHVSIDQQVTIEKMDGKQIYRFINPMNQDSETISRLQEYGFTLSNSNSYYIYFEISGMTEYSAGEVKIAPGDSYIGYTFEGKDAFIGWGRGQAIPWGYQTMRIEAENVVHILLDEGDFGGVLSFRFVIEEMPVVFDREDAAASNEDFTTSETVTWK